MHLRKRVFCEDLIALGTLDDLDDALEESEIDLFDEDDAEARISEVSLIRIDTQVLEEGTNHLSLNSDRF